jgi:hypothetical protein
VRKRGLACQKVVLPSSFSCFFAFRLRFRRNLDRFPQCLPSIATWRPTVTDFSAPDHLKGIDAAQKRQEGAVSLSARENRGLAMVRNGWGTPHKSAIAIAKDLALDLGVRYLLGLPLDLQLTGRTYFVWYIQKLGILPFWSRN